MCETNDLRDGVRMTRRLTLTSALSLPALLALSRVTRAESASAGPDEPGAIDELLRRWADRAAELVAEDEPNEDALLFELCADLTRVDPAAFPERTAVSYDGGDVKSGPVHVAMPFMVLQFDLEPGAEIAPHNHVGWGFISLGVSGEAAVRHYRVHGEAPEPGADLEAEFEVREVAGGVLTRGRMSSLSRARHNIHAFKAGDEGARFLDFGVKLPDPGDGPKSFSTLAIDPEPRDAERRIHTARWAGNPYR